MKLTRPLIVAAVLAAALAGAALAGVVTHKGADVKTIKVGEKEFHITLSTRRGAAGPARLVIKNTGKYTHGLAISGPGVKLKKSALVKPGKTTTLAVTLEAGTYTLWCPVPGPRCQGHEDLDHRAGRLDRRLGRRRGRRRHDDDLRHEHR